MFFLAKDKIEVIVDRNKTLAIFTPQGVQGYTHNHIDDNSGGRLSEQNFIGLRDHILGLIDNYYKKSNDANKSTDGRLMHFNSVATVSNIKSAIFLPAKYDPPCIGSFIPTLNTPRYGAASTTSGLTNAFVISGRQQASFDETTKLRSIEFYTGTSWAMSSAELQIGVVGAACVGTPINAFLIGGARNRWLYPIGALTSAGQVAGVDRLEYDVCASNAHRFNGQSWALDSSSSFSSTESVACAGLGGCLLGTPTTSLWVCSFSMSRAQASDANQIGTAHGALSGSAAQLFLFSLGAAYRVIYAYPNISRNAGGAFGSVNNFFIYGGSGYYTTAASVPSLFSMTQNNNVLTYCEFYNGVAMSMTDFCLNSTRAVFNNLAGGMTAHLVHGCDRFVETTHPKTPEYQQTRILFNVFYNYTYYVKHTETFIGMSWSINGAPLTPRYGASSAGGVRQHIIAGGISPANYELIISASEIYSCAARWYYAARPQIDEGLELIDTSKILSATSNLTFRKPPHDGLLPMITSRALNAPVLFDKSTISDSRIWSMSALSFPVELANTVAYGVKEQGYVFGGGGNRLYLVTPNSISTTSLQFSTNITYAAVAATKMTAMILGGNAERRYFYVTPTSISHLSQTMPTNAVYGCAAIGSSTSCIAFGGFASDSAGAAGQQNCIQFTQTTFTVLTAMLPNVRGYAGASGTAIACYIMGGATTSAENARYQDILYYNGLAVVTLQLQLATARSVYGHVGNVVHEGCLLVSGRTADINAYNELVTPFAVFAYAPPLVRKAGAACLGIPSDFLQLAGSEIVVTNNQVTYVATKTVVDVTIPIQDNGAKQFSALII